jgi:hypothetical protein
MRNDIVRKGFILGIIMLLVGTNFISNIHSDEIKNNEDDKSALSNQNLMGYWNFKFL